MQFTAAIKKLRIIKCKNTTRALMMDYYSFTKDA